MSETDWADKSQAQAGDSDDSSTDAASSQETIEAQETTAGELSAEADLRVEAPEANAPEESTARQEAEEAVEPEAEAEAASTETAGDGEPAEETAAESEVAEEPPAEPEAEAEAASTETAGDGEPVEETVAETPAVEPEAEAEAASTETAGDGEPVEETVAETPAVEPEAEAASAEAAGDGEPGEETLPSQPPNNPNHKWYILQTYSGFEHRVEKTIFEKLKVEKREELVSEIFVPGEDVERVKNGKKRKVHVIYYPGYVLINMELTDELWHLLMDIPRVSGFVGGTNREPRSLREEELGAIRIQMNQGVQEAVLRDEFEIGQQVIVIDGPFANFSGKIDEVNTEKNKLRVLISILGRSTPVELDFDKVKDHSDPA